MTQQEREERDRDAVSAALVLQERIRAAVRADYPELMGYLMPMPLKCRRARQVLREAVGVAASRISEAYGLGEGTKWAHRHFGAAGDERIAEAQVLASISATAV